MGRGYSVDAAPELKHSHGELRDTKLDANIYSIIEDYLTPSLSLLLEQVDKPMKCQMWRVHKCHHGKCAPMG